MATPPLDTDPRDARAHGLGLASRVCYAGLRPGDLIALAGPIRLAEKGDTARRQPASLQPATAFSEHA